MGMASNCATNGGDGHLNGLTWSIVELKAFIAF
jgi:hypothetical protein